MQRIQRKVGIFLPRTVDDAEVGRLLSDFDTADKTLLTIIEGTKAFRQAWTDVMQRACGMATDFEITYQSIPGDPASNARYAHTSREQAAKVHAFRESMAETREVVLQELRGTETNVIAPAKEARQHIAVYRKVIKKRQDRKLDYERYKSRAEKLEHNAKRSDRENIALAKHQVDLESAQREYVSADEHLKDTLPGLTTAIYSLLPHLTNSQIVIQTTLLGHYYTALHTFSQQYGYPIPSPEWGQVQPEFDEFFLPVRRETETLSFLQSGKAIKAEFYSRPDSLQTRTVSNKNGLTTRKSYGALPPPISNDYPTPPALDMSSKPARTTSNTSYSRPSPPPSLASYNSQPDYSNHATGPGASRQTSHTSNYSRPGTLSHATSGTSLASAAAASVAAKKKKPPPPPPKRKPSVPQQDYVTALYDFAGEGDGDLSFSEGDKIRVVKRTQSAQDWWEGECRGVRGSFPANYCSAA